VTYDAWDVVVARFPFSDLAAVKVRPALVLSQRGFCEVHDHAVLAMITTARSSSWPSDVAIGDLARAGLPAPSVVRMKLFTLDLRLVVRRIGALADNERHAVTASLEQAVAAAAFLPG
jgi:mRNA interferase MazF